MNTDWEEEEKFYYRKSTIAIFTILYFFLLFGITILSEHIFNGPFNILNIEPNDVLVAVSITLVYLLWSLYTRERYLGDKKRYLIAEVFEHYIDEYYKIKLGHFIVESRSRNIVSLYNLNELHRETLILTKLARTIGIGPSDLELRISNLINNLESSAYGNVITKDKILKIEINGIDEVNVGASTEKKEVKE